MCGQAAACDDFKGRRVLELGAGIGAAAIAAARCGASVLATDVAWRALALTVENAALRMTDCVIEFNVAPYYAVEGALGHAAQSAGLHFKVLDPVTASPSELTSMPWP